MNIKILFQSKVVLALLFTMIFLSCGDDDNGGMMQNPPNNSSGSLDFSLINDELDGTSVVVAGSQGLDFIVAFEREFAGSLRDFTPVQSSLPIIMEDDLGNRWDIFGRAISGPNKGEALGSVKSGVGFWFSFSSFYPGIELYNEAPIQVDIDADTIQDWAVPTSFVAQGAGFDGIPAIMDPKFDNFRIIDSDPSNNFYVEDHDLVMIVENNNEIKVYPHAILDWHEVINDDIGGTPIAVTYCPLTGTGRVWEREDLSFEKTFGVSGFLYNSNLIAFDRETMSFWSQITASAVFGDRVGESLNVVPFVECTWAFAKQLIDEPLVMTEDTGFDRDYGEYPYGNYPNTELLSYPILYRDARLPLKERVFCIEIGDLAKVYQFSDF